MFFVGRPILKKTWAIALLALTLAMPAMFLMQAYKAFNYK